MLSTTQASSIGSSILLQPAQSSFAAQALCTSGHTASRISCSPSRLSTQGLEISSPCALSSWRNYSLSWFCSTLDANQLLKLIDCTASVQALFDDLHYFTWQTQALLKHVQDFSCVQVSSWRASLPSVFLVQMNWWPIQSVWKRPHLFIGCNSWQCAIVQQLCGGPINYKGTILKDRADSSNNNLLFFRVRVWESVLPSFNKANLWPITFRKCTFSAVKSPSIVRRMPKCS